MEGNFGNHIQQQFRTAGVFASLYFSQHIMPPDLFFLSLADDAVVREPLCISHSNYGDRHAGDYEKNCVEDLESNTEEEAPQLPQRLSQWLRSLTTKGMRMVIAVEDPAVL